MHVSYTGAEGPNYCVSLSADNTPEIDQLYQLLCKVVYVDGIRAAPRGLPIKEVLNCSFHLENPRSRVITSARRNVKARYLVGELIWYLSGERKINRIIKYSTFWKNLLDEHGEVNSNYGEKIFWDQGDFLGDRSQFLKVALELLRDPDSRRAVISIHSQEAADRNPKDVPCTLNLQFFIRDERLHLSVTMRSNDLMLGFCNDVFQFTMVQELMLAFLRSQGMEDLDLGAYHHYAGSMHVYERHFDLLKAEVLGNYETDPILRSLADIPPLYPMDVTDLRVFSAYLCGVETTGAAPTYECDPNPKSVEHLVKMLQAEQKKGD